MSEYRNSFRIIGGEWRGRRLAFPSVDGLRPSPDRVRETLFNWLQTKINGASCLDLFAGSGALGFEALSRGAGQAVLVDNQQACCAALEVNRDRLEVITRCKIMQADALAYLDQVNTPFDIIFLDPPYQSGLLQPTMSAIVEKALLGATGRIYLEMPAGQEPALPEGWTLLRSKRAGNVGYHLAAADTDGVCE